MEIAEIKNLIEALTLRVSSLESDNQNLKQENSSLKHDIDGLQSECKNLHSEKVSMNQTINSLTTRVHFLEGNQARDQQSIKMLEEGQTDLVCRSMRNNIMIHNYPEDRNERPYQTAYIVREFLVNHLKMSEEDVDYLSIDRAHRTGKKKPNVPRSIVFNLIYTEDKDMIMSYARNLSKSKFKISSQFPPEISEKRKALKKKMSDDYEKEPQKVLKQDRLFVKGSEVVLPETNPKLAPSGYDPTSVDFDHDLPTVHESEELTVKGNAFYGYAAKISNCEDAKLVLDGIKAKQTSRPALHLAYAYRFKQFSGSPVEYRCDDKEWGAGRTLLDCLRDSESLGYIVVVARYMQSPLDELGPARFDRYSEAAKDALHRSMHS